MIKTGSALALLQGSLMDYASSITASEQRSIGKPRVRAVFVRPDVDEYWLGWPGAAYDIPGHQKMYTKIMKESAKKQGIDLEIQCEPIHDTDTVNAFLDSVKKDSPDGILITSMSLNKPAWPNINTIAENRGDIPTVVFSPMGTSFTGHLQGTRDIKGVFTGATQDIGWLDFGLRMLKTVWRMKNTRLCIVKGDKVEDKVQDVIGTTLHYIPRTRFEEVFNQMDTTDEMRLITEYYLKEAQKVVEPTPADVLNAVKNYFVSKRIMEQEKCDGISVDCLPLVGSRKIWPPCIAWSRLNDEGVVGACEADWNAAISYRLTNLLFDRPGFMQDPAPDTVENTLMGAHCSCATRLDGFLKPPEPFLLRSHSESNLGVAPQVLWRIGQKVTIMKFQGPEKILLGTGKVLSNIETPPAGGCRTSVELELDDVPDVRDTKGFHQLFIYGDLENSFKAYCQLAGIEVVHI